MNGWQNRDYHTRRTEFPEGYGRVHANVLASHDATVELGTRIVACSWV